MSIRRSFIVASLLLLALAACSSNDTNGGASGSTGAASPTESAPPPASETPSSGGSGETEVESEDSALGTILTDSKGNTLYVFMNDTGDTSTCTGDCAASWPALVAKGEVKAGGNDVDASLLGTSARDDGTMQVTYNGHPLYHFSGDQAPGDTNGQGIGGIWFVVSPAGDAIKG
jgi:predicted lipoprotein with Yx(FWY)xxD motif